jgi:8-oxo-dGTP pyrophosphatase MutT (NUDIX family)
MIEYRGTERTIIYDQAAALPFRYIDHRLEILLITSRKSRRWIIPKGLMEQGLSPAELAVKEAYEEAGIAGNISNHSLGKYEYNKWSGICRVKVYSLFVVNVLDTWPEDDFRFRKWFTPDQALSVIENEELKLIMSHFIRDHNNVTV